MGLHAEGICSSILRDLLLPLARHVIGGALRLYVSCVSIVSLTLWCHARGALCVLRDHLVFDAVVSCVAIGRRQ